MNGAFFARASTIAKIESEEERLQAIYILSNVHHEKRHFLDMVLTNYGTRYFRNLFTWYHNGMYFMNTMKRKNVPVLLPLQSFFDPLRREALLGTDQVDHSVIDEFLPFMDDVRRREEIFNEDNRRLHLDDGAHVQIGGKAQFESLAFMSQLSFLQSFGKNDYKKIFQKFFQKSPKEVMEYRWHEMLADGFNALPTREVEEGIEVINPNLLNAAIYAALNGPIRIAKDNPDATLGWIQPSARLMVLLKEIQNRNIEDPDITFSEAWDIVNSICKNQYGKDCIEEIELDIAEDEKLVQSFKEKFNPWSETLKTCYGDLLNLRKQLFQVLKDNPEQVLAPTQSLKIVDQVAQLPVFVNQQGGDLNIPGNCQIVFDYTIPKAYSMGSREFDVKGVWAYTFKRWPVYENSIAFKETEAWTELIQVYAPMCKLLTSGRLYPSMLGEEFVQFERAMKKSGVNIVFDPSFEVPKSVINANRYWNILGLKSVVCDFCAKEIQRGDGALISPWVYKVNSKNRAILQSKYPQLNDVFLIQDWSNWVTCDKCLTDLSAELEFE
ncbi:MAG TPA: hypothetical protein VGD65_11115 [Chryseosolibacter sp.]